MYPPPRTSREAGSSESSTISSLVSRSLVRYGTSESPSIGGKAGRDPVAIRTLSPRIFLSPTLTSWALRKPSVAASRRGASRLKLRLSGQRSGALLGGFLEFSQLFPIQMLACGFGQFLERVPGALLALVSRQDRGDASRRGPWSTPRASPVEG